jgi:hypothetical protein
MLAADVVGQLRWRGRWPHRQQRGREKPSVARRTVHSAGATARAAPHKAATSPHALHNRRHPCTDRSGLTSFLGQSLTPVYPHLQAWSTAGTCTRCAARAASTAPRRRAARARVSTSFCLFFSWERGLPTLRLLFPARIVTHPAERPRVLYSTCSRVQRVWQHRQLVQL